jgi:outer membrane protein OmpA-like peptidoglycan-associated protein
VTLAIAAPVVEARAAEQEPEIIAEPASQTETFNAPAQSGCDLSITITGYSSGMVSLSADQQALLAPALAVTNCSVSVIGYSSTSGSATTNEQIALDRASAVLEYLVQHGGVFTKQEAASAGETSEFGPEQRNNRRVVVQLQ